MGLLEEIFPGLEKGDYENIPEWGESEHPWSILDDKVNGIQFQISKIVDESGIFIHPTAKIGDCVRIEGPSYVGPNAEIRHGALLREGSWICEGALVGHSSEIKNSILLPNSKAPHFNYVGDSIVGFEANLGAGVKLSNVRNDGRGVLVTIRQDMRVESGLMKLGALVGDYSQIGCNTVTNPGTIIGANSMIPPNTTVNGWHVSKS